MFISLEGSEGCGKSTQGELLRRALIASAREVVSVREPGGTVVGEQVRELLLTPGTSPQPWTEALLYAAARAELVAGVIAPSLAAGADVLADRFADSSLAYQGYGRGLDLTLLRQVQHLATGGLTPDLTLLLEVPVEEGLRRARRGGAGDRLEREDLEFHQRLARGYRELAADEPGRWVVIDASGSEDDVAARVWAAVSVRLHPVSEAVS